MIATIQSNVQERRLVVTADDLGLAPEINRGIIDGHVHGIVTSASLLMNAPATEEGIALAKAHPRLQVGIHLGFVEGLALSPSPNSLTDEASYFDGRLCLHRHWKDFLKRYASGRINPKELRNELRLQIEAFLKHFPSIPFANGTQHLHLLPGILPIVLDLCREYKIAWLRLPVSMPRPAGVTVGSMRRLQGHMMSRFARIGARSVQAIPIALKYPDHFLGFTHSGAMTESVLLEMLGQADQSLEKGGVVEIMVHPGRDAEHLRRDLPWAYGTFDWEGELAAVTSAQVRAKVAAIRFQLGGFP